MRIKPKKIRIGLRTLKTAVAVVIAMTIVDLCGTTDSRLIFAMLGAMAAMEPTFKESLESCMTQTIGVFFGAIMGVILIKLPFPTLIVAGVGIILVITSYNVLRIRFSPSLPCLIVVTLCITPDIQPWAYAFGRFWDTAIGLGIGMIINTMVFPYDNSRQIHDTAESLECEVIYFLEDMFDGDNILPNTEKMTKTIDYLKQQLVIFSNQWNLLHWGKRHSEFASYKYYEEKARQLIAHMEVLCEMGLPGILDEENCKRLADCGANIIDKRIQEEGQAQKDVQEKDIVTNYHVSQLLTLREELLELTK